MRAHIRSRFIRVHAACLQFIVCVVCVCLADAPLAATQTTTLGKGVSVPRNQCITAGFANTFPQVQ